MGECCNCIIWKERQRKGLLRRSVLLRSSYVGVNNDVVAKVWSVAEIVVAYDDKVDFIRELEAVPGIDAAVKTVEFLNENLWKDDKRLRKLRNHGDRCGDKCQPEGAF
ncbi:hypothetical protein Tco_1199897 [Tanacetum coccineum]